MQEPPWSNADLVAGKTMDTGLDTLLALLRGCGNFAFAAWCGDEAVVMKVVCFLLLACKTAHCIQPLRLVKLRLVRKRSHVDRA